MNKIISVQYAYKKDGKGERHGDQAERMLASQASKHGVQPTVQPLPPGLFNGGAPSGAPMMMNGEGIRPGIVAASSASDRSMIPNGPGSIGQQRAPSLTQPLPNPPSGLPPRPPPSQAGFSGHSVLASSLNSAQPPVPGFHNPVMPPPFYGAPPGRPLLPAQQQVPYGFNPPGR